jgi:hypothetical protein
MILQPINVVHLNYLLFLIYIIENCSNSYAKMRWSTLGLSGTSYSSCERVLCKSNYKLPLLLCGGKHKDLTQYISGRKNVKIVGYSSIFLTL